MIGFQNLYDVMTQYFVTYSQIQKLDGTLPYRYIECLLFIFFQFCPCYIFHTNFTQPISICIHLIRNSKLSFANGNCVILRKAPHDTRFCDQGRLNFVRFKVLLHWRNFRDIFRRHELEGDIYRLGLPKIFLVKMLKLHSELWVKT